jgi:hypothetical protein
MCNKINKAAKYKACNRGFTPRFKGAGEANKKKGVSVIRGHPCKLLIIKEH